MTVFEIIKRQKGKMEIHHVSTLQFTNLLSDFNGLGHRMIDKQLNR